ncbi:MAG TPA: hypothetical protein VGX68_22105 [Thermoanaerobaculia bacterium]|jgi:hypothetical protein|nr:hypothetical protein [Thermoanaerobaculia bacterium]
MQRRTSSKLPLVFLLLALAVLPALGAPLPSHGRTSGQKLSPLQRGSAAKASATLPAFQAIGLFGDLAVINPTRLLSVATQLQPDFGFGTVSFLTGLARDPVSGKLFVVGTDFGDSFLGEVDFATGRVTTVGSISGEIVVDIAFDGAGVLYGLTDNADGATPHALLRINPGTAAATLLKVLDAHGGTRDFDQFGALAWNSADQSLYYADLDGGTPRHLFIDKLASGSFAQTGVLTAGFGASPYAMAFANGRLWIMTNAFFYSADAVNFPAGLVNEGIPVFPTPDGEFQYVASGFVPAVLPCVPGPTVACLHNRFKIEVSYDAGGAGAGPGNVVLESTQSVKFTFFDPANIEIILKVLYACVPAFNKWWVFGGGLTNVGVTVKVTDTATGAVKTYTNPKGRLFRTFADTGAFACP